MEFTENSEIKKFLEELFEENPFSNIDDFFYFTRLKKGDFVLKSDPFIEGEARYLFIDDPNAVAQIPRNRNPLYDVLMHFKTEAPTYFYYNEQEIQGKKAVPFSEIVKVGVDQCLETSVALHFMMEGSWLCGGFASVGELHAWVLTADLCIADSGLRTYSPLDKLIVQNGALIMVPDYKRMRGEQIQVKYQIGGENREV